MKAWQIQYPKDPHLTISVNISGKQLAQADFFEQVTQALEESGLAPHSLKLEITESAIMENLDYAVDVFNRLREKLSQPYSIYAESYQIDACFGAVVYQPDYKQSTDILLAAEQAMRVALPF